MDSDLINSPFKRIFELAQLQLEEMRHNKKQEIYDLIEEEVETELPKKETKKKINKSPRNRNTKLFEGRNIIKKVKTHCLKIFYKSIKECTDLKEKVNRNFRLKIHEKKNIYKTFKSDISKYRNRIILNLPMRKIMPAFSNINISDKTYIKEDLRIIFNFLMNCRWYDILLLVKRRNKDFLEFWMSKNIHFDELTPKEVKDYMDYIKNGTNNYKDRINLDKNYLKLYEWIIEEHNNSKQAEEVSVYQEIDEFLTKFTTFEKH